MLAALVLIAAACGKSNNSSANAPTSASGGTVAATSGVTDKEITVALLYAKTGPSAAGLQEYIDGVKIWADAKNAAGGINGRMIKVKEYDHGETADGGVAACNKVLSDGDVFLPMEIQGYTAHVTAANCFDKAGVPNIIWEVPVKDQGKWKHTYGVFASGTKEGTVAGTFLKANTTSSDKVAFAVASADVYKETGDAALAEAKRLGVNVVDNQSLDVTATTYLPQLQHMKDAGATVVFLSSVGIEAVALKEAQSIGFKPKWIGVGFSIDLLSVPMKGGVYNGVIGIGPTRPSDAPGYAAYDALATKFSKKKCAICASQFVAYGFGELMGKALESAGKTPTRASLEQGLGTIDNFDPKAFAPITWTTTHDQGTELYWPQKCCTPAGNWTSMGTASSDFTKP